jgi:hypothetical protein
MKTLKTVLLFIAFLSLGLFINPANAESKAKYKWPSMLVAASGGISSPGYIVPLAWSPVHEEDTGVVWRVIGEPSTVTKVNWLKNGVINFLYTNMQTGDDIAMAGEGLESKHSGPTDIRVALPGFIDPFGPMTLGRTGIKTIDDLKKRPKTTYAVPISASGLEKYYEAFRAYLGVSEKQLVMVPYGSWGGMVNAMNQGKVDIITDAPTGLFAARYSGTQKKGGIVFLDWPADDPGNARFSKIVPTLSLGLSKSGVPEGRDKRMILVRWVGFTYKDQDPEVVYRIIKWHEESYERFKTKCTPCPRVTMEAFRATLDMTFVPVHEGVIRYFKEKGMWTAADDLRQEYNLKFFEIYMNAFPKAVAKAEDKDIKAISGNKKWVDFWHNYRKEAKLPTIKIMSDKEITAELPELEKII